MLEENKNKNTSISILLYILVFIKNYGIAVFDIGLLRFLLTSIPTVTGFGNNLKISSWV